MPQAAIRAICSECVCDTSFREFGAPKLRVTPNLGRLGVGSLRGATLHWLAGNPFFASGDPLF
jgi:hypothetical protein